MKNLNNNRLMALCFLVIFSVFSVTANAAVINFNSTSGANGGTVSYVSGGPLIGTGIAIGTVSGIGTVSNAGSYACNGCVLSFATGFLDPLASSGGRYVFGGDGFFEITGLVDTAAAGAGVIDGSGGFGPAPLLTGSWTGQVTVDIIGGVVGFSNGVGVDTKNPELLSFFGISSPDDFSFANTNIFLADLTDTIADQADFSTNVNQAIVANISTVPLPGAVWLLGSALIGMVGFSRRES